MVASLQPAGGRVLRVDRGVEQGCSPADGPGVPSFHILIGMSCKVSLGVVENRDVFVVV